MDMFLSIQLPRLVTVDDYHEFPELSRHMIKMSNHRGVKVSEVGFDEDSGLYVGVVYVGRKPSKRVIDQLAHIQRISWGRA